MAAKKTKKPANVEWLGGIESMPAYVDSDGAPFRPEVLVWMGADGDVLGTTTGAPGTLLAQAVDHLHATIAEPRAGRPHAPDRIRVASPDLANVLREACAPAIAVTLAPTPELDAMLESLRDHLGDAAGADTYLGGDVDADAMGAFFRAATGLHRVAPWSVLPGDAILSLSIEALGVTDAVFTVFGQQGKSHGVMFFEDIETHATCLDAASAIRAGQEPRLPPQMTLEFIAVPELPPSMVAQVAAHRWEVPNASVYPELMVMDEDFVGRTPTAAELRIAEALALALTRLVAEKRMLRAALDGGEPIERTFSVATRGGELDVTIRAPHPGAPPLPMATGPEILAELLEIEGDAEDLHDFDDDRYAVVTDDLMALFQASPEAEGITVRWSHPMLHLAASHLGVTLASMDAEELREALFDLYPRKVSIGPDVAGEVIAECRALFAFAKRELGMENADACLAVLGADAVEKLESALSDTSQFGISKTLMMAAAEMGVDMSNPAAIEAWMQRMHGDPLASSMLGGAAGAPRPTVTKAAARAKKNQRKATRKARRKQR